jgi:hypothetical protein
MHKEIGTTKIDQLTELARTNQCLVRSRTASGRFRLRLRLLFALAALALLPAAQAVSPPPGGGYPGNNTAEGDGALFNLTTGTNNTANGFTALKNNQTGSFNTATGRQALFSNSAGGFNTATGNAALGVNTGNFNTATGNQALNVNTTGGGNVADGSNALFNNTSGNTNIALGYYAGSNLTTGSDNIDIGNPGVAGEADTIRIGTAGTHSATFIAGIRGVTTTNADAIAVVIDSAGQLGTVSSSERFKKEIKPMDKASEAILALEPVTFRYKNDGKAVPQFGLIAEEVAKVDPGLVVRNDQGEVYTVRYDAVNAMLLNEFLKQHRTVQEQQATIAELRKGMAAVTAQLKEQEAQIQKVGARLEANRAVPQMADNR